MFQSRPAWLCVIAVALHSSPAAAQAVHVERPTANSVAGQDSASTVPWPRRTWIAAGVGVGSSPYGSLDAIAAGWYSVGRLAAGGRLAATGQWFGEQRID